MDKKPVRGKRIRILYILAAVILFLSGCSPRTPRSAEEEDLRVEISISERELYVYRQGDRIRTYPIAVGQPEYPTPIGDFSIHRIDWNPDWTPPASEWAEDATYTPPGHPDNPMGRVRILYQAPYSIHGTEDIASLGKAASHGSIRMSNPDVIELATILMEAAGAAQPDAWYERVLGAPGEMVSMDLPTSIPLTNRP
jgi:lipoprotein-anchoring transpeptidase ErfK/SrfK